MPLHHRSPPPESLAALSTALHTPIAGRAVGLRAIAASLPKKQSSLAHPVYVLGLDSLVNGAGLGDAKLVGWRYLVGDAGKHDLAAEISVDAQTHAHAFASFNQGPFVDDTAVQIAAAERDPHVVSGSYELRLLRIPAVHLVALWLKDLHGADDLFRPVGLVQPPLKHGSTYSWADLEKQLGPAAQQAQFDDRPKP